jgi:hypothetical protein
MTAAWKTSVAARICRLQEFNLYSVNRSLLIWRKYPGLRSGRNSPVWMEWPDRNPELRRLISNKANSEEAAGFKKQDSPARGYFAYRACKKGRIL